MRELESTQQERPGPTLQPLLADAGHPSSPPSEPLDAAAERWLKEYFLDHILPVITPQAIDPAHPFPFVANQGVGALFNLTRLADGSRLLEMVLIPSAIPRFVRVPGEEAIYIAVEQLVVPLRRAAVPGLPRSTATARFRVLRDSDIELEEEAEDLVRFFRTAIQRRRRGKVDPARARRASSIAEPKPLLREQLGLERGDRHQDRRPARPQLRSSEIVGEDRPDLKFAPYTPRYPERVLEHDGDCFAAIREKDIVIHHPYESFEVVVDFLRQAAADPAVVSIKQTLYRAGNQSPVIAALIEAAEAGKSVTAVVELKARFDEEQNLKWASAARARRACR